MKKLIFLLSIFLFVSCNKDEPCECRYALFNHQSILDSYQIGHNIPCGKYEIGEKFEKNPYFEFVVCLDDNPEYCYCIGEGNWTDEQLNEQYGHGQWTEEDRYFTTPINCGETQPNDLINVGNKEGIFLGCVFMYN